MRRTHVAPAAVISASVGFVLAVDARPSTSGIADLALAALVLVSCGVLAAWARRGIPSRVIGVLVALVAAWLLPQRSDIGSALILAGLFGTGVGLVWRSPVQPSRALLLAMAPIAVLGVCRVAGSQDFLVAFSVALVAAAALSLEQLPADRTPSRWRHRALAVSSLVVTATFAVYVGAETPGSHWFGGGITHGPLDRDEVALTFDDGPNLTATLQVMRILDAAGVKGTFFEVGHAIDKVPWITEDLYKDGQGLGNHSYHHDQWRWLDPFYPELQRTQDAFARVIRVCPSFYRPPHGDRTPFVAHVVSAHHMRVIMWDDSAGDWAVKNPRTVARRILRGVRPGSIIVLHDGLNGNPLADRRVVVRALPAILAGLRARHLRPVRLDQLIGGPAFIPCH